MCQQPMLTYVYTRCACVCNLWCINARSTMQVNFVWSFLVDGGDGVRGCPFIFQIQSVHIPRRWQIIVTGLPNRQYICCRNSILRFFALYFAFPFNYILCPWQHFIATQTPSTSCILHVQQKMLVLNNFTSMYKVINIYALALAHRQRIPFSSFIHMKIELKL